MGVYNSAMNKSPLILNLFPFFFLQQLCVQSHIKQMEPSSLGTSNFLKKMREEEEDPKIPDRM